MLATMLVAHGIKDEETLQLTFNGNGLAGGVMVSAITAHRASQRHIRLELCGTCQARGGILTCLSFRRRTSHWTINWSTVITTLKVG
jgi:hypothetical protein